MIRFRIVLLSSVPQSKATFSGKISFWRAILWFRHPTFHAIWLFYLIYILSLPVQHTSLDQRFKCSTLNCSNCYQSAFYLNQSRSHHFDKGITTSVLYVLLTNIFFYFRHYKNCRYSLEFCKVIVIKSFLLENVKNYLH